MIQKNKILSGLLTLLVVSVLSIADDDASKGCENVGCPAMNGEFAISLPNPLDCGSFCKCDWGQPNYFQCLEGLHFNAELQICDWPANAGCELKK